LKTEDFEIIALREKGYRQELSSHKTYFSFVSPYDGGYKMSTGFTKCREILCSWMRTHIREAVRPETGYIFGEDYPINMDKLRLLTTFIADSRKTKMYKDGLFSAKHVLNILEEYAGFSGRSSIKTVKVGSIHSTDAWLITGPKEWIECPQFLSLAALILRIGGHLGPFEATDIESLKENFLKLIKQENKKLSIINKKLSIITADVTTHLETCKDRMFVALKYRKKLFGKGPEKNYEKDRTPMLFSCESGITSLCNFRTDYDESLSKKFLKLCKKEKV
jgi:hypothetical protein